MKMLGISIFVLLENTRLGPESKNQQKIEENREKFRSKIFQIMTTSQKYHVVWIY